MTFNFGVSMATENLKILKRIGTDNFGSKLFLAVCSCGETFKVSSKQISRNKTAVKCRACQTLQRKSQIAAAVAKKKTWIEPETRTCRSCGVCGPVGDFPGKRNTCRKCHNVGRNAYYHLKKSREEMSSL